MSEVFQGINSRVSKVSIQSELIGSPLNNITRSSKNVINIEISEPLLFDDKTYTIYLGNTEISDVYIGDNLLTDISFIIT